ncbi:zinc finger CCHC domain-containing protein 9-like isoform X2 [Littorina saxatilis]|uniref:zinc finger CCHC domain-containing protein 9-like isoform X2 n=1 Tax=Littorina saxatilis TaxID=31220 RepID=UPI0038B63D7E
MLHSLCCDVEHIFDTEPHQHSERHSTPFCEAMTRTAKRGAENKKRHDASDWSILKSKTTSQPPRDKRKFSSKDKQTSKWNQGNRWQKARTGEEELLHLALHKEQRRERRREKRVKERQIQKVCFKCRLPGHKVEECLMNNSDEGTGICYKCGSTEHSSSACKSNLPPGKMPFASCYVCGKQGHIAKACPDNPKGLYPMGGGCKTCGSVEHFQRDCAEYLEKQGIGSTKVKLISLEASVDAEDDNDNEPQQEKKLSKKKKAKVVKF